MSKDQIEQAQRLKIAVLAYLNTVADRHYNDLSPLEKNLVDLAQALNTRLDQLIQAVEGQGGESPKIRESPEDRLGRMLTDFGAKIQASGRPVDNGVVDELGGILSQFDTAREIGRQSQTVRDRAETAAIRRKMRQDK